jgi:hypothetical protein
MLLAVGVSALFLVALSLRFDFGDCEYPSRAHPFFISGRLIIGVVAPFFILLVRGLEFLLSRWGPKAQLAAVAAIAVVGLASWNSLLAAALRSEFNWFHLR